MLPELGAESSKEYLEIDLLIGSEIINNQIWEIVNSNYDGRPQSKVSHSSLSFQTIYCEKRLRVRENDVACTSRTSRVLTVASLQLLKMKALILTPADYEMRSIIKFLNAKIEIHRQQCQIYGHKRLDGQNISCRSSAGRCLIIIRITANILQ